jgi:MFS transporter, DHA1 family, tetracycline resistance protein
MHVAIAIVAIGGGVATPAMQGWLSRTAGPADQGLLLGFSQTAQTFGRGVGLFVASALFTVAAPVPFLAAAAFALAAGVLAFRIRAK